MAPDHPSLALEPNKFLKHQKTEWKIERVGWVVMALLLLAALAGFLGPGPMSEKIEGDRSSSLWVEYRRFERYQAPTKMTIHLRSQDPQTRLWFNHGFMRRIDLKHIDPQPERSEAGTDRYTFPLRVTDQNQEIIVTVYFEPNEFGMMHTEVGLDNGPSLRFWQLVYP